MRALLLASAVLSALVPSGCIEATNPYDPDAPLELQARAAVRGAVTDAAGPVEDAAVVLRRADGEAVDDATTDAEGAFSFSDLAPGGYVVSASSAVHAPVQIAVVVGAGQTAVADLLLVRASAGALTGVVRLSAQLALPEDAQDHSGATVEVEDAGGAAPARAVTNRAGRFDLPLAPGSYTLVVTAPGHAEARVSDVTVEDGGSAVADPIVLSAVPGALRGVVTPEDVDVDTGGNASGTTVTLLGTGASTITDATGAWQLSDVPAGVHALVFSRARYETLELPGVLVQAGVTTDAPARVLVRASGVVTGTVTLPGASSHADILVSLVPAGGIVRTDSAGAYTFTNVAAGIYSLQAEIAGYQRGVVSSIEVLGGDVVTVAPLVLVPATGDFDINGGAPFTNDPVVTIDLDAADAAFMMISTDPTFTDAALGDTAPRAYEDTTTLTLPDTDGQHIVYVMLEDAAGTASGPFVSSIVLDTEAPYVAAGRSAILINGGATYTNDAGALVTLTLEASDVTTSVTHMQIVVDGLRDTETFVPFSPSALVTLDDDAVDGLKRVEVRFRDAAGNESAAAYPAEITLDRAPPDVDSFTIEGGATYATSSFVELAIAGSDALSGVSRMAVSTNGAFPSEVLEPFASARAFLLAPGDGTRFAFVKLVDGAGNRSDAVQAQIEVDTQAPTGATVQIDAGAALSSSRDVVLTLGAQGASEMEITDQEGNFERVSYAVSHALTLPGDGPQTVFVVFFDDAGNASATVSDTIEIDEDPPVLTSLSLNDGALYTSESAVTLSVVGAGASLMRVRIVEGCASVPTPTQLEFDAAPLEAFSLTKTVLLPPNTPATNADAAPTDRCKHVAVQLVDAAGNVTAPAVAAQRAITLDGLIPDAPQIATQSQVVNAGATFLVSLGVDARDHALASYQIATTGNFVDAAPVDATCLTTAAYCSFNVPLVADSENVIRVRARDAAGNVSDEDLITVREDSSAPATPTGFSLRARDETINATWTANTEPDVDGYELFYTLKTTATCPADPAQYNGTFADQGRSPIDVGNNTSASLTGMPNGIAVCVAVRAYDRTAPPLRSALSRAGITPFEVTPTLIAETQPTTLGFAANATIGALSLKDGVMFIGASNSPLVEIDASNDACFSAPDAATFATCTRRRASVDTLVNPVRIVTDGAFVFVADQGAGTKIYRANGADAPVLLFTIGDPAPRQVAVGRGVLAVATSSGTDLYDLNPLYQPAPLAPTWVYKPTNLASLSVDIQGSVLAVGTENATQSVLTYDITLPSSPSFGFNLNFGSVAFAVKISGGRVYGLSQGRLAMFSMNPPTLDAIVNVAAGGDIVAEGPITAVAGESGFDYVAPDEARVLGRLRPDNATTYGDEASVAIDGHRAFHASGVGAQGGVLRLSHAAEGSAVELLGSTAEVDANSAQWVNNKLLFSGSLTSLATVGLDSASLDFGGPNNGTGQEAAEENGTILVAIGYGVMPTRISRDGAFENAIAIDIPANPCREVELMWPFAYVGCRSGGLQRLVVVDLRAGTLVSTTTISTNASGFGATDALERYGAFLYMSANDGTYRVEVNPHTGAIVQSTLVDATSNSDLHRYGRHLWMWASTMRAQDIGAPRTWDGATVSTIAGAGAPSYGNVTEVGGMFFVPTTGAGVNMLMLAKDTRGKPSSGTLQAIIAANSPRSVLVAGDRLFVGNVSAMDIHRIR